MTALRIGLAGLGRQGKRYIQYCKPAEFLVRRWPGDMSIFPCQPCVHFGEFPRSHLEWLEHSDRVIIATPSETHADLVIAALEAGKPTLCEKPLCTTKEDLARIREVWTRTGTPLLVAHTHLWHPTLVELRSKALALPKPVIYDAAFGDDGDDGFDIEWLPHAFSLALACGFTSYKDEPFYIEPEPQGRQRVFSVAEMPAHGKPTEALVFNGDDLCDPPPMARMLDDFMNLRQDYRWGEFGFKVTEAVLDAVSTSDAASA